MVGIAGVMKFKKRRGDYMNEATVTMEYLEKLIRDSEKVAIVTRYVEDNKFIDKNELRRILGLEKESE